MIVMGIDPGTATTGWGIIQSGQKRLQYVASGVIVTQANMALEKRLVIIFTDLITLLKRYQPQACGLEQLFFNTNAKTALLVGQARGVVLLALETKHVPIFSYTPLQVKMAICGYGRADKRQVQEMVKRTLKLESIPKSDDAADALAVAMTQQFHQAHLQG